MDKIFTENLRGFEIKFKTRPGVFSSKGVDQGTKLLINSLGVKDETLIADLGSGTGIIGMVCAKLNPHGYVHLLDDHLRSVKLAKENVELNNLDNVEIYLSDLFSAVPERTYHQIFTNPPQQLGNEFLEELIFESLKHLKTGGELWLVVKKNIRPVIERILKNQKSIYKIVVSGQEHSVIQVILPT